MNPYQVKARKIASDFNREWDLNLTISIDDLSKKIATALLDAANDMNEKAASAVGKFLQCEFDPRLAPLPDEQMKLVYKIREAIRALKGAS